MHLFFRCPFAQQVWRLIPLLRQIHIADDSSFQQTLVLFRKSICLPPTGIKDPILPWVLWYLWMARNRLIFENLSTPATDTATKSLSFAREWSQAQPNSQSTVSKPTGNHIAPLQSNRSQPSTQCWIDAAWDASTSRAGVAWTLGDLHPFATRSGSRVIENVSSSLMAETLALKQGISSTLAMGISNITFLSDCQKLTIAINSNSPIREAYGVFQDIAFASSSFAFFFLSLFLVQKTKRLICLLNRPLKPSRVFLDLLLM